jgi:hypothetical protein
MKVLCPFVTLHPRAKEAFDRFTPWVLYPYVGDSDVSYLTFLKRLWAEGQPTIVVEHDIEIHEGVVPALEACPEPWCSFPFARLLPGPHSTWDGEGWSAGIALLTKSLGCVRWSGELMATEPDVMEAVGTVQVGGTPPGHWKTLDDAIARVLEARGYRVCVHAPEVRHHHWLERWETCSCEDAGCRP